MFRHPLLLLLLRTHPLPQHWPCTGGRVARTASVVMTTIVRQHDFEVGLVTMGRVESVCVLVSWSWLGCDDVSKLEWAKTGLSVRSECGVKNMNQ